MSKKDRREQLEWQLYLGVPMVAPASWASLRGGLDGINHRRPLKTNRAIT
jgi:hypothetical protein